MVFEIRNYACVMVTGLIALVLRYYECFCDNGNE